MILARLEALFRPIALSGFRACAEAIAPSNDLGAPDVDEADMVARADAWWRLLPPDSRRLLMLLYTGMELGAPLLLGSPRRLSRLPVERRLALFEGWRTSKLWPLRFVADAVKSPVVMMYLSHPRSLEWLGATTCEHPFPSRATLPQRPPFPLGDGR
ncbi:MAG: hypothetical protein U1F43_31145 [Myxococcota bacterium]